MNFQINESRLGGVLLVAMISLVVGLLTSGWWFWANAGSAGNSWNEVSRLSGWFGEPVSQSKIPAKQAGTPGTSGRVLAKTSFLITATLMFFAVLSLQHLIDKKTRVHKMRMRGRSG